MVDIFSLWNCRNCHPRLRQCCKETRALRLSTTSDITHGLPDGENCITLQSSSTRMQLLVLTHYHTTIADRRHSLFGHICRLPENTPASQALQLSIEAHTGTPPAADWKRPTGCPRRNWLQQLEEDTGLSVGAAWIAGQDRSMWRTLWPSAGQVQQWVSEWVLVSLG